ncbi:urea transporter, partial [Staphylococcus aureus]|uniref:urea transporter n=1 Tax=Staphylococcus aureus TaxID=1280 RepID=UPI002181E89E
SLGGDYPSITNGLYGYNSILTGIALGATFKTKLNTYIAVITGLLAMTTQFSKLPVTIHILPQEVQPPDISHNHISWLSGITTNFSEIFL